MKLTTSTASDVEKESIISDSRETIQGLDRESQRSPSKSPSKKKRRAAQSAPASDADDLSGLRTALSSADSNILKLFSEVKNIQQPPVLSPEDPDFAKKSFCQWVLSEILKVNNSQFARFQRSCFEMIQNFKEETERE